MEEIATDLYQELVADGSRNIILDVRHDNGGNSFLAKPLIHMLIWFEQVDKAHRIFVITSRNTFSAAQIFITQLEQQTNAVFVGEPASSSPNFTGEDGERSLCLLAG